MGSKLWIWAKGNKIPAVVIVLLLILVLASASDGWSARRMAARSFDLARGWAKAYQRDTSASKKEYEAKIKGLSDDRDAYKKKWEDVKKKMDAPWTPPKGGKELKERFDRLGYEGTLR